MAAGVLRVVFVYDLAPGVLLTISLSLSVLGSIVEQAFGLLPSLCFLLTGLLAFMFGVVSLASDGRSLRWHHHPVFPRSFSLVWREPEVVSWFDVPHVHDHTPLPFSSASQILSNIVA